MIENFRVDKTNLYWTLDAKEVSLHIENLDQAMLDDHRQKVIMLCKAQPLPDKLLILNEEGNEVFSFSPPDGAAFYYLTKSEIHEVLVVCVFHEKLEGWHDWHFSIDIKNKKLIKTSPAY